MCYQQDEQLLELFLISYAYIYHHTSIASSVNQLPVTGPGRSDSMDKYLLSQTILGRTFKQTQPSLISIANG